MGRIARKEPTTAAGDTRYTIDVDEVTPVLAKLVELLGSHGDGLALASSLFVLDVPVAVGNQPIARYAYRRGWSHVEMAAHVKNARVQRAMENAKRRRDEARLGLGFSDDSLLETDVLPADLKPRLASAQQQEARSAGGHCCSLAFPAADARPMENCDNGLRASPPSHPIPLFSQPAR